MIDWDQLVLGPVMAVFGGKVRYQSAKGWSADLADAVFDKAHTEVVVDGGEPVSTTGPVLGVRLSTLPGEPGQDDKVTITDPKSPSYGETYVVRDVRRDGLGWAKLMLNEAAW